MQGSVIHTLNNGRLISLPIPLFSVTYAVLETDEALNVFLGMKKPGVTSKQAVLERCKTQAPGLNWKIYVCAEIGSTAGSPHDFTGYSLRKDGERLIFNPATCGDMVTAFQGVQTGPGSGDAKAIQDINNFLEGILPQGLPEASPTSMITDITDASDLPTWAEGA